MFKETQKLYLTRCELFFKRLLKDRFQETIPLEVDCAVSKNHCIWEKRNTLKYKTIKEGDIWAEAWDSAWFKIKGKIPNAWKGKEVVLEINTSGETLIFDDAGVPIYAVTGNSVFNTSYHKDLFFPPKNFWKNGKIEFCAEASASSLFGVNLETDPHRTNPDIGGNFSAKLLSARMGVFNREAWALRFDFEILLEILKKEQVDSYRYRQLLTTLNDAIDAYADLPENASVARKILAKELNFSAKNSSSSVSAVGHAHIDVAWLWPVRESWRKAVRTFASQLEMIRQYPGYIFGASQPQLYEFVEKTYPALFKKIQKAVKDGSWELQGGMWVEADANLISGESMVRQFIHGKNYFKDKFDVEVKNLWLPDVFGYSANLPQIIRKSGCEFFLTQKLSWNQFNTFPHNTFIWKGVDGSEVLTHFPPENTYNASATPAELIPAQDRFRESDRVPEFASLFGLGDGGGGPSENHIERASRMKNLEGCPKVHFGKASDFFNRIKKYTNKLNRWDGELYFEMHRGTLTNQSRTKKNNRTLEQLLQTAEFLFASGDLKKYPYDELHRLWRVLLLNQFHDIIPGSSIQPVYEVTEREHTEAIRDCKKLIATAAQALSVPKKNAVFIANTLGYDIHNSVIELPSNLFKDGAYLFDDLSACPIQIEGDKAIASIKGIPANSYLTLKIKKTDIEENALCKNETPASFEREDCVCFSRTESKNTFYILENSIVRYIFDTRGELVSAFDKSESREIIPEGGRGNVHLLYNDRPNDYEGWDIDIFYRNEKKTYADVCEVKLCESGPVRSSLLIRKKIGRSVIEQYVSLTRNNLRLDFKTNVDWQETRQMLRVEFPVAINAKESNSEIQYATLARPLHENTSWDMARFETVAHRFADLSEDMYGVALLNDCKYGYLLRPQWMELCLLRSAMYPDPRCENGEHTFTYSLFPHSNNLKGDVQVQNEAAALNRHPIVLPGREANVKTPFYIASKSVSLEVLKRAEKSDDLVLRLYETTGESADALLLTSLPEMTKDVRETNLIEWEKGKKVLFKSMGKNGSSAKNLFNIKYAKLSFKPFEIKTFIIKKK